MSNQAFNIRKTMPSPRELREAIDTKEYAREMRAGIDSWAEYLVETGRIYQ